MGRERIRPGKHLHFYVAYLIPLMLCSGCSNLAQVREHLRRSQDYIRAGDYRSALAENQRVLMLRGERPPSDRALFNIALIYANPDNPKRDLAETLAYFNRLESRHPESTYAHVVRVWRSLVEENKKLAREVVKRRLMLKRAWDDNRVISKLLEKHNVAIQRSEKEKRKLSEELEKLNHIILESKKVDIEIEAKKRQSIQ